MPASEPSPLPLGERELPQYSLKALLLAMTAICLLVSGALYLGPATLVVIPLGLVVFVILRDRWALLVVGLYGLILVALTVPLVYAAFGFGGDLAEAAGVYASWPYWIWFDVMLLSQAALLTVPVKVANRRPVSRRKILFPILASGLMMGGLGLGAVFVVVEFIWQNEGLEWSGWPAMLVGLVTWCFWTVVFFVYSRGREPMSVVSRQCRCLLQGSILELLVAVPVHVVARYRDYCCAGVMTFVGISLGFSVMLFSFGPAVFFLFLQRYRRVRPAARKSSV